jgi:hypothetical protein
MSVETASKLHIGLRVWLLSRKTVHSITMHGTHLPNFAQQDLMIQDQRLERHGDNIAAMTECPTFARDELAQLLPQYSIPAEMT